jgi:hypothetical protein
MNIKQAHCSEEQKIERQNKMLVRKFQVIRKPHLKQISPTVNQPRLPSSAINRRKQQRKINHDNMILLRTTEAKSMTYTSSKDCVEMMQEDWCQKLDISLEGLREINKNVSLSIIGAQMPRLELGVPKYK